MIKHLFTATAESFLLLRRDKIFLPAVIAGVLIVVLANMASDWSIEDFDKILFDIGTFGFHLTGSIVALFWGTKAVVDSRKDGTLEVDLAAPVSRTIWLMGKFLGLCFSLGFLAIILMIIWQGVMILNQFGWMTWQHIIVFFYLWINWIIVGAVATFFATFCSNAVALFSGLCFWLIGLSSASARQMLSPETPEPTQYIVKSIARFWDLQQFNLSNYIIGSEFPSVYELSWRLFYGVLLVLLLSSMSCVIFHKRDLT